MRRGLSYALLIVALVTGADIGAWRWLTARMVGATAEWVRHAQSQGWVVEAGPGIRGGFPFAATLVLPGLRVAHATQGAGPIVWRAERISLRLGPLHPRQISLALEGSQRLELPGFGHLCFAADSLVLALTLHRRPGSRIILNARNLRAGWEMATAAAQPAPQIRIGRLRVSLVPRERGQDVAALKWRSDSVALYGVPPGRFAPLGPTIDALDFDALLRHPICQSASLTACALAWRDAGGRIEIPRLQLRWGTAQMVASASLALDSQLQPTGAMTAQISGFRDLADTLAQAGLITSVAAVASRAALGLLVARPAAGNAPFVEAPMTLRDRLIMLGQIPLARLPALPWRPSSG